MIRRRCNLSFNESHSLKTDDLETRSVSGEDLVPLLSGKRTTDAPKRGSLSTHDCSCTSLFKRIIGSCFTAAFAAIVTLLMSSLDKQDMMFTRQALFKSSNEAVAPPLKLHRVYFVWQHDEYSSLVLRQIVLVFMT